MRTAAPILALVLCILCAAAAARAGEPATGAVRAVLLSPASAQVTETAALALASERGLRLGRLALPAAAATASLRLAVEKPAGLAVADVSFRQAQRRDEARIAELAARVKTLEREHRALVDERAAHAAAADYWRTQASAKENKPAEARDMAAALLSGLKAALAALADLDRRIEDAARRLREAREELERATGGGETVWEAAIAFAGPAADLAQVRYTYTVGNCGWEPRYALDARPAAGRVDFAFDALIRQQTGRDWADADLTLATAALHGAPEPPPAGEWIIRPAQPLPLPRQKAALSLEMAAAPDLADENVIPEPEREEGRLFDRYALGKATLRSGDVRRMAIRRPEWKADFDLLLRPQVSAHAFLRARAALAEPAKYPAGRAAWSVDRVFVREGSFSLFGREAELFLGPDPQVSADLRTLTDAAGEKGLFGNKKTHAWDWRLTVTNAGASAARLRVEDALPRTADQRISVEERLPGAAKEDGLAVWTLDVPPGRQAEITYGYTVTYPADMEIEPGR
ncbi:MAG: DUF4139 domain-containing protein [Thermodesulfobacteriota bacterium]